MSTVRLQVDLWLKAAKEFLDPVVVENIHVKLRLRGIKLTQNTFASYVDEFALLLERENQSDVWKCISKISAQFIISLPIISNKRAVVNNHNHFYVSGNDLEPIMRSLTLTDDSNVVSSLSSEVHESTPGVGDLSQEDVIPNGILFPIVCKLTNCAICRRLFVTMSKCKKVQCKRKHRLGVHYLSHMQRRKLLRAHRFQTVTDEDAGASVPNSSRTDLGIKSSGLTRVFAPDLSCPVLTGLPSSSGIVPSKKRKISNLSLPLWSDSLTSLPPAIDAIAEELSDSEQSEMCGSEK